MQRRAVFAFVGLVGIAAVGSVYLVLVGRATPALALPWLALSWSVRGYVRAVRQARELLRDAVMRRPFPEREKRPFPSAKARSLRYLARAFEAARRSDSITAELCLARVDRGDLGEWELRVFEAVRALVCLEHSDGLRAAQLAPLAIPTGNDELDRELARLMVRAAWTDEHKLRAIESALLVTGRELRSLSLLCRVRQAELAEGEGPQPLPLSRRVLLRVADEARAVGDERMADELVASVERQGVYR